MEKAIGQNRLTTNIFIYIEYLILIIKYERGQMRVFNFDSYKTLLRTQIKSNSKIRGYQARMAEAAGCQPSYFSQMLSSKVDLTLDHASGIADFLELHGLEQDYFFTLVNHARASTEGLRRILKQKLDAMKTAHLEVSNRVSHSGRKSEEIERVYYSSWTWTAVHIAVSCKDLQTIGAIAKHLGLRIQEVQNILEQLRDWGFVERKSEKWIFKTGATHLSPKSPMNETNHLNWRARAANAIQKTQEDSLHYSSVFTVSVEDYKNLKELVIQTIVKSRDLIAPSESEKLVCLNCDVFEF